MAAEEPKAVGEAELGEDEQEAGEDPEARAEKLNPQLLAACMKNESEAMRRLLDQQADPCCEDERQFSPLIWSAFHGNEKMTRYLISLGATEVYKYDENTPKAKKKQHSPLHWAAFKGRLKVLWLLLGQQLSHHETDQIGNTVLHQAAAGGSLDCTKCLMGQGADVFAKNDRGHTPYVLCTVKEVQELLQRAMKVAACKASGKQFSSTVLRYLCSFSLDVFCQKEVWQMYVYESHDADKKEKPVTWCLEVKNMKDEAENQLNDAWHLNQLDTITAALEFAGQKPVDCKLVHKCQERKAKLESEIQLNEAMKVQVVTNLEEFNGIHEQLSKAIDEAEAKGADPSRIQAAKTLRRKLMAEASLMRTVQGPQKTTLAHITVLEELANAARAENADEDLLTKAINLIRKLKSEHEVQQRIGECQKLVTVDHFKDAAVRDDLPHWCQDTEKYENFHEDYKRVVEQADKDKIEQTLMTTALGQLAKIENLLVEKKLIEEEQKLKASKKKKKG